MATTGVFGSYHRFLLLCWLRRIDISSPGREGGRERERGREGSTFLQSGAAFGVMKRRSTVSECLPASTVLRNLQTYYLGFIPPLSDQVLNLSRLTAKFHPSESKYCRSGRCWIGYSFQSWVAWIVLVGISEILAHPAISTISYAGDKMHCTASLMFHCNAYTTLLVQILYIQHEDFPLLQ